MQNLSLAHTAYVSSLSVAHTEFCIIYMLFTASFQSVYSTYRVNHTCLCIYASTDVASASSTYVLDFYGMPLLQFLRHTEYLY